MAKTRRTTEKENEENNDATTTTTTAGEPSTSSSSPASASIARKPSSNADELADNAPNAAAAAAVGDESMAVDSSIIEDWLTKTEEERKTFRERGKKMWESIKDNFGVEHAGGNLEVLYMLLGTGNLNIVKWPWTYHRGEHEGEAVPKEVLDRIMTRFSKEMLMEWNDSRKMMTTGPPEYFNYFLRRLAQDEEFILILDRMDSIGKELIHPSVEIAHAVNFHYLEGERPKKTSQWSGKFQGGSGVSRLYYYFAALILAFNQC